MKGNRHEERWRILNFNRGGGRIRDTRIKATLIVKRWRKLNY